MENTHFKAHYTGRLSNRTCLHMQKIKHIFKYISCRSITCPEIGSSLHVLRNLCAHITIHTGCFGQFCRYTVTTLPLSPPTYTSCRGQFTCCQMFIPRFDVTPTGAIIECLLQEVQTVKSHQQKLFSNTARVSKRPQVAAEPQTTYAIQQWPQQLNLGPTAHTVHSTN
jgi:hypothetical protein